MDKDEIKKYLSENLKIEVSNDNGGGYDFPGHEYFTVRLRLEKTVISKSTTKKIAVRYGGFGR